MGEVYGGFMGAKLRLVRNCRPEKCWGRAGVQQMYGTRDVVFETREYVERLPLLTSLSDCLLDARADSETDDAQNNCGQKYVDTPFERGI